MSLKMYKKMVFLIAVVLIALAHTARGKAEISYNQECGTSTSLACPSRSPFRNLPRGRPLNIVLMGKTGHGKSATANSIFGHEIFHSEMSSCSVTTQCQKETRIVGGREICLVDTPGTMDTKYQDEVLKQIGTAITLVPEGFDAFVIVLRIDIRITEEEKKAITLIKTLFGRDVLLKYGVLVFTHGDIFVKQNKKTFQEHILSEKEDMKQLLEEFGYRCALIDNTREDPGILKDQVIHIITLIDLVVTKNGGSRYTNDLFVMAQKELEYERNKQKAILDRKKQEERDEIVARRVAGELRKRSKDCFPPDALVTLYDGRTITIADLRIGHKVLSKAASGTLEYSEVYFFAHLNPNVSNEYINLRSFKQNLKLTPQHHIYIVRNGHLKTIAARDVIIGDSMFVLNKEMSSLLHEPVTEISTSTEFGIYAPITMSGTIIVNNILASCYVDLVPPKYSHPMLWPLRQLYRLSPSLTARINAEGKDGMPIWVQFIMDNLLA